ncbi:MAG: SMC family ATPase [Candidatus Aenigmarchaeota archaeon]|nr:SMC family ATPase [Candidatus Aenigmarchaeota archaeon]
MIKRIRLSNWKSHLDTELAFEKGVNILVGIMGSGKTSVIDAISFALYGTFPGLQNRRMQLDDLIISRPRKERAEIELEFMANGKSYEIKREIKREKGTTNAEIREDGKLLDVGSRNVTQLAASVLQMDYDLFSKAVYSEQNAMDYFLRIPKGQRMQHIDRMLKLDRFEMAREKAIHMKNIFRQKSADSSRLLDEMRKEDLSGRLEETAKDIGESEKSISAYALELEKSNKDVKHLREGLSAAEKKEKRLHEASKKLSVLEAGRDELEMLVREAGQKLGGKAREELETILSSVSAEVQSAEDRLKESRLKGKKLAAEFASIGKKLEFLTEEMKRLEKEMESCILAKKEIEAIEKEHGLLDEKIRGLEEGIQIQNEAAISASKIMADNEKYLSGLEREICPVCGNRLPEERRKEIRKEKEKEIRASKEKRGKAEKQTEEMQNRLQALSALSRKLEVLKDRIRKEDEIREMIRKTEDETRLYGKSHSESWATIKEMEEAEKTQESSLLLLKGRLDEAKGLLDLAKRAAEMRRKQEVYLLDIKYFANEIELIRKEAEGHDIEKLRLGLQDAMARERELSVLLSSEKSRLEDKRKQLDELRYRLDVQEKLKEKSSTAESAASHLDAFVDVLQSAQQALREEFVKNVNTIMAGLWPALYPYGDFQEVRLAIDGDYVLEMRRHNIWASADGIVSGGERSMASLALRIAFSIAFIPNLRWLILDEPTHNLDSNAIDHLSGMLRNGLPGIAEQIFLITHEERLSEGAGRIYRLERDKAGGGPSVAVEL